MPHTQRPFEDEDENEGLPALHCLRLLVHQERLHPGKNLG